MLSCAKTLYPVYLNVNYSSNFVLSFVLGNDVIINIIICASLLMIEMDTSLQFSKRSMTI